MNWTNNLTLLLKIAYPIVQAPMLGVTSPAMVAAVSNLGGLGSLPVGGLSPEKTKELIRQTKALTNKPFAVNLFAHEIPDIDKETALQMQSFLADFALKNHLNAEQADINTLRFYSYKEQIQVLLDEAIPIVSFTFGILNEDSIQRLKHKGVVLIGTATSVKEARLLAKKNIDIITAQGIEAGGHRGTFIHNEPLPQVGSISLIPQIVDNVKIPVLASGGINDGRTIKAAFILGAAGVQIGTAFIASHESQTIEAHKTALANSKDTDTALTRAFSGRWARGLRNRFMEELEKTGLTIPDYPIQNTLTTALRISAQHHNNREFTNLWAGQSASKTVRQSSAEIFTQLIKDTERLG